MDVADEKIIQIELKFDKNLKLKLTIYYFGKFNAYVYQSLQLNSKFIRKTFRYVPRLISFYFIISPRKNNIYI